ncbi:MAG: NAD(P)H-dependent glycerol-3-phosphate dehydrogenase [Victivallaceae bacterium]
MIKKKITCLGLGIWGFCLANLLAEKGYRVVGWSHNKALFDQLIHKGVHPKIPDFQVHENIEFSDNLTEAIADSSMIVESVTCAGIRPVCNQLKKISEEINVPFILTSKGIEQNTGLFLSDVVIEIFGEKAKKYIGCLSGPSIAQEVLCNMPCSVVCSGYDTSVISAIHEAFSSPKFRVYPNSDIRGVSLGGALKNIIAIACGISDGLKFGDNAKAGLITRGLHEIRKFASVLGCRIDTINGLSGMGDLCVTCFSKLSRNYRCGKLIAEGLTFEEAKNKIGMAVEGAYTAVSASQIALHHKIELPITDTVYKTLYEGLDPFDGVKLLMQRHTKEEYL